MLPVSILAAGHTDALCYGCDILKQQGFSVTVDPSDQITHLLLPVPSFDDDSVIKGGEKLDALLQKLPRDITVIGGNLNLPSLAHYEQIDLLQDAQYLAINARITAYCAISLAMDTLPCTLDRIPLLVVGWGRIGKCLAQLLQTLGADVTVAARKETDRAALVSLGFKAVDIDGIIPQKYRLIFNTAPQMLLPDCPDTVCKIDLASKPGIGGNGVIWARGLPNKLAPESSGQLIAERVISYLSERKGIA